MPQDAFTIKYVAKELEAALSGGKVTKIIQPDKDTFILYVYTAAGVLKLDACFSAKWCRLNLASADLPAPKIAPAFCMLLRKHLSGAKITGVEQVDGERIVYIDFLQITEFERRETRLYCELMGKYSNAVLTEDGKILGSLKTAAISETTKRALFTGAKYLLPEPQDKIDPNNICELEKALSECGCDRAKFIAERVKGVAYSTAVEIVEEYGENLDAKCVNRYICGGQLSPCVTYRAGEPYDFKVRSCERNQVKYDGILKAQTAFYAFVTQKKALEDARRKQISTLSSAIKKLEKRLATIEDKLFACRDMESVKLKGELITANIYAVERHSDVLEAVNYYDENCPKIKIALDKTLSPAENAQRYYKKYAKMKRTVISVTEQKRETEERLSYLKGVNRDICAAECLYDLAETGEELKSLGLLKEVSQGKKQKAVTVPFRAYTVDGFKVYAGRNNVQNDRLLKWSSPRDIWLHTQGYHSSHVVIVTEGKEVPDSVLLTAAEICAYYSDGRDGSKIPVDYCLKKFVKKPSKANAGFVVYTDYRTVLCEPNAHAELAEESDYGRE